MVNVIAILLHYPIQTYTHPLSVPLSSPSLSPSLSLSFFLSLPPSSSHRPTLTHFHTFSLSYSPSLSPSFSPSLSPSFSSSLYPSPSSLPGGDDMRQDAVMQQVFQYVNHTFECDDEVSKCSQREKGNKQIIWIPVSMGRPISKKENWEE